MKSLLFNKNNNLINNIEGITGVVKDIITLWSSSSNGAVLIVTDSGVYTVYQSGSATPVVESVSITGVVKDIITLWTYGSSPFNGAVLIVTDSGVYTVYQAGSATPVVNSVSITGVVKDIITLWTYGSSSNGAVLIVTDSGVYTVYQSGSKPPIVNSVSITGVVKDIITLWTYGASSSNGAVLIVTDSGVYTVYKAAGSATPVVESVSITGVVKDIITLWSSSSNGAVLIVTDSGVYTVYQSGSKPPIVNLNNIFKGALLFVDYLFDNFQLLVNDRNILFGNNLINTNYSKALVSGGFILINYDEVPSNVEVIEPEVPVLISSTECGVRPTVDLPDDDRIVIITYELNNTLTVLYYAKYGYQFPEDYNSVWLFDVSVLVCEIVPESPVFVPGDCGNEGTVEIPEDDRVISFVKKMDNLVIVYYLPVGGYEFPDGYNASWAFDISASVCINSYLTYEEFLMFYAGNSDNLDIEWVELQLESGSAYLRSVFKTYRLNLDIELAEDNVELINVKTVLASLISRKIVSANAPLGGDFSNISQSAGDYSQSLTMPSGASSNFYLTQSDLKSLNLPSVNISQLDIRLEW